jgi:hypothetical protein
MSTPQPPMPRRRIASILWFPIFFAIALPVTFEVAYHQPQPHNVPIAVVGPASHCCSPTRSCSPRCSGS